jgi:hypothetical protein
VRAGGDNPSAHSVALNLLANENSSAAVPVDGTTADSNATSAKRGAASMPAEWHLVNQLAHPLVELRRFDDVDDSEFPIPREY